MTERPILFNAEMVRAVLSGAKTQTRRVIKHLDDSHFVFQASDGRWLWEQPDHTADYADGELRCPYGVSGDRLWARETWADDDMLTEPNRENICFRADGAVHEYAHIRGHNELCGEAFKHPDPAPVRWRPSIFMPRWASRITREVTEVRAQRVQDISEADAQAEGAAHRIAPGGDLAGAFEGLAGEIGFRNHFHDLWDDINAKPRPQKTGGEVSHYTSYPWGGESGTFEHRGLPHIVVANPWVWAVSFKDIGGQS